MKTRWNGAFIAVALILAALVFVSCTMDGTDAKGSLILQLDDSTVSKNIFTTTNDLTGDMDIQSYKIILTPSSGSALTYEKEATSSTFVLDALTPGSWTLTIEGYNSWDSSNETVSGEQIAYLEPSEDTPNSEGSVSFIIKRGTVTTISGDTAFLVPVCTLTGDLDISVNWNDLNSDLYTTPTVAVTITQINNYFSQYATSSWEGSSSLAQTITNESVATKSTSFTFDGIPVGWYEVTVTMTADSGVTYLKRMGYVRIIDSASSDAITTTGTFTITDDTSFATGSLDLSISEEMDPLTVTFDDAYALIPDDSSYSNLDLSFAETNEVYYRNTDGYGVGSYQCKVSVSVSNADTDNTLIYKWYVNGELATDADTTDDSNYFTYSFPETGLYTVTAVVLERDASTERSVNWGSASVDVSVVVNSEN